MSQLRCQSKAPPSLCHWTLSPDAPPLLAGSTVEMTPWESCALQTEALRANLRRHNTASQGLTADMKRNHDFSSSDSELEEPIEVEKESADENG